MFDMRGGVGEGVKGVLASWTGNPIQYYNALNVINNNNNNNNYVPKKYTNITHTERHLISFPTFLWQSALSPVVLSSKETEGLRHHPGTPWACAHRPPPPARAANDSRDPPISDVEVSASIEALLEDDGGGGGMRVDTEAARQRGHEGAPTESGRAGGRPIRFPSLKGYTSRQREVIPS